LRGSSLIDLAALYASNCHSVAGIEDRIDEVSAAGLQATRFVCPFDEPIDTTSAAWTTLKPVGQVDRHR